MPCVDTSELIPASLFGYCMQESAEKSPNCKAYRRRNVITLLNSLLSAMPEEATFKLNVLQSHLNPVWAVPLPFHLLSTHLLGVMSDSCFLWLKPCENLAYSWCQSYNGRSRHSFRIQKQCRKWVHFPDQETEAERPKKLVSGGAEQELHGESEGRKNDLHMHRDLGVGRSHGCKYTIICSPTCCIPCIGRFFDFLAWSCPFTLCTH